MFSGLRHLLTSLWNKITGEGTIEIYDRYDALSIPRPDPETVCLGKCEGTGWVPIDKDRMEEPWRTLWLKAEAESPSDDGWHFVKCPDCDGTGHRKDGHWVAKEASVKMRELLSIQGADGNWNSSEYMRGMYNGMECIIATLEHRDPVYRSLEEAGGQ
jgi:hypothetical protein